MHKAWLGEKQKKKDADLIQCCSPIDQEDAGPGVERDLRIRRREVFVLLEWVLRRGRGYITSSDSLGSFKLNLRSGRRRQGGILRGG